MSSVDARRARLPWSVHLVLAAAVTLAALGSAAGTAVPAARFGASLSATIESTEVGLDPNVTLPLTAAIRGGIGPYSCLWNDSLGVPGSRCGYVAESPTPGQLEVVLTVRDAIGQQVVADRVFPVFDRPTLALSGPTSGGDDGVPLQLTAQVAGGTPPLGLHWTTLPDGRTTAVNLAGDGPYGITVAATLPGANSLTAWTSDAFGVRASATVALGLFAPAASAAWLDGPVVTDVGTVVVERAGLAGGTAPWTFAAQSDLPLGNSTTAVRVDNGSTLLTWTAAWASAGNATIVQTATDSAGGTAALTREVRVAPAPTVQLSSTCPLGQAGRSCAVGLNVSGGTPPFLVELLAAGERQDSANLSTWGHASLAFVPGGLAPFPFVVVVDDSGGGHARLASQLPFGAASAPPKPPDPVVLPYLGLGFATAAAVGGVWLRRRRARAGRAIGEEAAVIQGILRDAQDSDRPSLELVANSMKVDPERFDRAVRTAIRRGELRGEPGPDGEELYSWVGGGSSAETGRAP